MHHTPKSADRSLNRALGVQYRRIPTRGAELIVTSMTSRRGPSRLPPHGESAMLLLWATAGALAPAVRRREYQRLIQRTLRSRRSADAERRSFVLCQRCLVGSALPASPQFAREPRAHGRAGLDGGAVPSFGVSTKPAPSRARPQPRGRQIEHLRSVPRSASPVRGLIASSACFGRTQRACRAARLGARRRDLDPFRRSNMRAGVLVPRTIHPTMNSATSRRRRS